MLNAFQNINDALDVYDWSINVEPATNLERSINPICAYVLLRLFLNQKYERGSGILFFGTRTNNYCDALIQLRFIEHQSDTSFNDRYGDYQIRPLGEKYVKSQFPHYLLTAWILLLAKTFKNLLGFAFVFSIIVGWSWSVNALLTALLSMPIDQNWITYFILFLISSVALVLGTDFLVRPVTYSIKYHHGLKHATKMNFIRFLYNSSLVNVNGHTIRLAEHSMFPPKVHTPLLKRIRQKYHDHW